MALRFTQAENLLSFLRKVSLGSQATEIFVDIRTMEILDLLHTWISTVPVHNTRVSQRVYCINVKKINCNTLSAWGLLLVHRKGGFHPPYWQPGPPGPSGTSPESRERLIVIQGSGSVHLLHFLEAGATTNWQLFKFRNQLA